LRLAIKIERWTGGQVPASSVCKIAAKLDEQGAAA
jgi:hypothetical protein